ncbi:aconitate hydratase [Pyramidobacter porci]
MNLTEKIIASHLVEGEMKAGSEIALKIDQTLTQDALGMMTYLAFETMGVPRVQTEVSVSYLDHNLLYADFRNPDDHAYLTSIAKKYGLYLSRAGNGICHSIHTARFARPGRTAVGTDSHTPSAGAVGMLGFGAGGIEVAAVMAGEPFAVKMPHVVRITLTGRLRKGVNAKDAALVIVRRVGVKGGIGKVFEYAGAGLDGLTVPERMTLANLGAETGATSSLFPSDAMTEKYFAAQGRLGDYRLLGPDLDAVYDEEMSFELDSIEPMVALPHQPDRVVPLREVEPVRVDQVFIGSCTNSSYSDLTRAAAVLRGKTIAPGVSFIVSPGTRQNYLLLLRNGVIETFAAAGARILECGCGPCVGVGQAVRTGGVSLRTSNRNFKGRCGTKDSSVYLVSPETAAASALAGYLTGVDTVQANELADIAEPEVYGGGDALLIAPNAADDDTQIVRGPNIKPIPLGRPLPDEILATVVIKLGDNVSTDEIAPAGPQNMANRANIEAVSVSTFERIDPGFARRARNLGSSVIVAGENYGQGSSREHAALMPAYLGVKAVLAKSFARIHRANLINFGILPLIFTDPDDYEKLDCREQLELTMTAGKAVTVMNTLNGALIRAKLDVSDREREILRAGGLLNFIRRKHNFQVKERFLQ